MFKQALTAAQVEATDDLWNAKGLEMSELFCNEVPHVRGELAVKPTGMPPSDWSIA